MDNYSPSHPTDDTELGGNEEVSKKNFNNELDGVFKKLVSQMVELKKNENEVDKKIKGKDEKSQGDDQESSDEKGYRRGSIERRNRSDKRRKSIDRRSWSRERKGSSRVRRERSRSRGRRSRSRNKSGRRDSRNMKDSRQSSDRRNDRSQRSPDMNSLRKLKSRSKSPFNKEFRPNIRRRDKSPELNSYINSKSPFNKELQPIIDGKMTKSKRLYSPEKMSWSTSVDNNENDELSSMSHNNASDNIFSKLTELRTLPTIPTCDTIKEKWSYDSDEEANTQVSKLAQDTFSHNRGRFQNYDERPFRGRQYNCDRRGRGSFREFQRDNQWGQDRNDTFSNEDTRNIPRCQNRNDNFNQRDNKKTTWGQVGQESTSKSISQDYSKDCKQNDNINEIPEITHSISNKSLEAGDSDEDFGTWTKKDSETTRTINFQNESGPSVSVNDINKIDENKLWMNNSSQSNSRENIEGGFVAWKNAQKIDVSKVSDITSDKFTGESDEEFGSWGKELKSDNKSPIKKDIIQKKSVDKIANEDSDDEFGAWGSERKVTSSNKDEIFPVENQHETSFQQGPRPSFQNRNNYNNSYNNFNNNSNNQFGQRRGGPRNFNGGNRFQGPPSQDRTFNASQNNSFTSNYNMNFNSTPQIHLQDGIPQVRQPFNYNNSQWNLPSQQMSNVSYLPIVGGKLPFPLDTSICPPMGMIPPMQHPMMQQMSFIPPPPPNVTNESRAPPMPPVPMMIQPEAYIMNQVNRNQQASNVKQMTNINQPLSNITQSLSVIDNGNLLETLMTQAGLSSDSLRLAQEKKHDLSSRSVGDTFSTILKSAATSVISRLVESSHKPLISDNMSMSPPSPPTNSPPLQTKHNIGTTKSQAGFIPPPLPNYSDVLKPSINKMAINNVKQSDTTAFEDKRNRSDFDSKNDWQERVAAEVKMFLKPAYMSRSIDKNDYKEIMKRCVTKITRSGVTEINREKIEKFVLSYVDKYNKNRKTRQHSAVSSSEHDV